VITVSHDRYFLDRVVDHLLVFEGNGILRQYEGHYTSYLEVKKQEEARESSGMSSRKRPQRRKLSYKEKVEWNEIEERISGLEQQVATFKEKIAEAGSDLAKVQELYEKQQKVEQNLDQAMERW